MHEQFSHSVAEPHLCRRQSLICEVSSDSGEGGVGSGPPSWPGGEGGLPAVSTHLRAGTAVVWGGQTRVQRRLREVCCLKQSQYGLSLLYGHSTSTEVESLLQSL
jgi:hypothetical protein